MIPALILAAVVATPGALPPAWQHWKYERAIATPARGGIIGVVIPATIYANAQPSLNDLRVVDANGNEVPFAIATPAAGGATWFDGPITDKGFVEGRYSQAVADFGGGMAPYGRLEILTPLDAFATHVDVDASDDGTTWRTIRTDAPIYDYERDGLDTNTEVSFPASTARFIRVRVLDGNRPFPIEGLRITAPAPEPQRTRYRVSLTAAHGDPHTSVYLLAGIEDVPIDRFLIDSTTPQFARGVSLEVSSDGDAWQMIGEAVISRHPNAPDQEFAHVEETQARMWRLTLRNGNDRALAGLKITAFGVPRRVTFEAAAGTSYRLVYGDPSASAPEYDFGATHAARVLAEAGGAALGPPETNPSFVTSVPWSERNPWLLWAALAIAVAGIAAVAIKTMATRGDV